MSVAEVCTGCGWITEGDEPPQPHRCMVVERRVPRFSPLAIDPVPVDADDVPEVDVPSRDALLFTLAKVTHERDEARRKVNAMQEDFGRAVASQAIAEVRLEMAQRQLADARAELREVKDSAKVLAEAIGIRVLQ